MRVLIDTNVLFSAALNPNSTPFQAYVKAVTPPTPASSAAKTLKNCEGRLTENYYIKFRHSNPSSRSPC